MNCTLCFIFYIELYNNCICFDLYATVRILYNNKFMYASVTIIIATKLHTIYMHNITRGKM